MANYRIRNVSKNLYGDITHVGERGVWTLSKETVIQMIRSNGHTFYVQEVNPAVQVRVVDAIPPYLRTVADSTSKNNLDNLPSL